jgi:hypothetical protein
VLTNRPALQGAFINVITVAQGNPRNSENRMQKSGIKAQRDNANCSALNSLAVQNWMGTASKIDANSDGKGVLAVATAKDVGSVPSSRL